MAVSACQKVRFGPFELDARSGELYKHDLKLKLQGHPIEILQMLLEHPGELVTREEIRQRLWPTESDTFVDFEHGLNTALRKLRQALGDEADTPLYIETLPRRGYRFVGKIAPEDVIHPRSSESPIGAAKATRTETPANAIELAAIADKGGATVGNRGVRLRKLSYRAALVALLFLVPAGLAAILLRPSWFHPRTLTVVNTKRLTFNEHVALRGTATLELYDSIQSDGRRVYYTVNDYEQPLRYISEHGGKEKVLSSNLQTPIILHLSPDGSTLLVKSRLGHDGSTEAQLWLVPVEGGSARRLGDIDAQDAVFAPDSNTIVFAKNQDIYLTNLQGASPVKLAIVPGRAFWLRWSPDGAKLRFSVVDPKRLTYGLWELRSDGKLHQLLTGWQKDAQICCGVWTAGGEYFLFRRFKPTGEEVWSLRESKWPALAGAPTLLAPGSVEVGAVVASPLEKKIFASVASPVPEALVSDPDSRELKPIELGLRLIRVTFSRDGKMLAGTAQGSDGSALWRLRADGSDIQQLTTPPLHVFMADYSPDGQRIAFMARWPHGPWKIYWVSASGGAIHEIASEPLNQSDPSWSPDGRSILFGQVPRYMADSDAERNLYIHDLSTGKTTKLPNSTGLFSPRWSPDGRYIAALTIDQQSLVILDLNNGLRQRLDLQKALGHPFWSLDSKSVYFTSSGLTRYRVSDGTLEPVAVNVGEQRCSPLLATGMRPDGALLFICLRTNRDIYAFEWN